MSDETATALAQDRIIDITTTGRKTARPALLGDFTSKPGQEPAAWVAGSPLVEVTFPEEPVVRE